jgi:thiamine biosynthesis lipoprotein
MRSAAILLLIPVLVLAICGCGQAPPAQHFVGHTMGTTYSVTVTRLPQGVPRESLQSAIDDVLKEVNEQLSTYDPASEISAFNASATTVPFTASPSLQAVVAIAQEVSAASGGAFDITVAPLVRAWGFGEDPATADASPDPRALGGLRATVGYQKLELTGGGHALRKTVPGLQLDVAGIAPGYAVDRIAGQFEALGVHDYLVELGGEIRARGRSPAGRPWRVAVETPLSGERRPYTLVELDAMSASTSGDYRDFRVVAGRRLSHTIDPRTGTPVTHGLASVCVLHPSAAYADAYATALMVLGPAAGKALAEKLGLAAFFIERAPGGRGFREQSTPQFEQLRRPLT